MARQENRPRQPSIREADHGTSQPIETSLLDFVGSYEEPIDPDRVGTVPLSDLQPTQVTTGPSYGGGGTTGTGGGMTGGGGTTGGGGMTGGGGTGGGNPPDCNDDPTGNPCCGDGFCGGPENSNNCPEDCP